jgi:hypothetical protein
MVLAHDLVGRHVECKARQVMSFSECSRRYGAAAKTHKLRGVINRVYWEQTRLSGQRQMKWEVTFDLINGRSKTPELFEQSVKLLPSEGNGETATGDDTMVENNNMQQLVNQNENLVPTYGNDNNIANTTTTMNDINKI